MAAQTYQRHVQLPWTKLLGVPLLTSYTCDPAGKCLIRLRHWRPLEHYDWLEHYGIIQHCLWSTGLHTRVQPVVSLSTVVLSIGMGL